MKTFNHRSMIRSAARRIWMWSPARKQAIRDARVAKGLVECCQCKKQMKENAKEKEYRVDHIIPASEPAALIKSWDDFFERLFTGALQILCIPCHEVKTKEENAIRKSVKPKRKRTTRSRIRKTTNG